MEVIWSCLKSCTLHIYYLNTIFALYQSIIHVQLHETISIRFLVFPDFMDATCPHEHVTSFLIA